jgi:hypothetical protein
MHKQDSLKHMITILVVLALFMLSCQLFSSLFNSANQPQEDQVEQNNLNQPDQPEVEESDQIEGELNGAGPQEDARNLTPLDFGGIQLFYDSQVILEIVPESVPGSPGEFSLPYPPYIRYVLRMDYGTLELVDVFALKYAAEISGQELDKLADAINSQDVSDLDCIPEIQLEKDYKTCKNQEFHANVGFVDFENGSGLRFVTIYMVEDYEAVANHYLEYVYQGITANGECYLKGNFKISHDRLDEDGLIPSEVFDDSSGRMLEAYFEDFANLLNGLPDGYFPSLEYLDRIIRSIAVGVCGGG